MKHLKLFFALFAMLALGVGNAWAEDVTETITMKGFAGITSSGYQNVTKTGASDKGTAMVAYAYNGSTGQVRGNKTTVAGASVTTSDNGKNWSLYNSEAMAGAIKAIKVTQTATGSSNKFQNNLYVSLGTSSQGSITATTNAQKQDAGGTAQEINFTIDASKGYTYFKLLSTEKFVTGTIAGVVVTVTYETSSGGDEPVASLSATPTTIDFGTVYQGADVESKTVAVNFANLTGDVTYSGLSTPFTATGAISATGDKITISADASTIGERSQTLTIQSAADSKTAEVTVRINVEAPFNGKKLDFDFVNHPTGWPVKSNATAGEYVYNLDDTDYTFKHSKSGDGVYVAGTSGTSGYLLIASGNTLGLPAIKGRKLVKVQGTLNNSGSPSTLASVSITDGTNTLSGGTAQTWNEKGGIYTYSLSGTQANTMYYLSVSNKNLQMITLVLYYEECEKYALTITEPTEGGTLVVKDGENTLASGAEIYEGTKLTVTATPETGYEDGVVVVKNASDEDVTADVYDAGTLTMPAYAVTISATFEKKPCTLLTTPVVTATPTYNSATLTWAAVANAAKYSVKVGTADAVETEETSYEVTGLNAETTYTYQVQAIAEAEQDTYCDSEVAEGIFTTAAAPVATLTLSDIEGTTTQTGALNGTITLPTTAAECSKTFVGWDADENCDHAPTYAPGAEYTFTTLDPTLYAVYADGESGEAVAIFSETFDACDGTGGNDDKWSGDIAKNNLGLTGWDCIKGYAAKGCAKFGGGSDKGSAETPAIALTGDATLTFKAAAWSGDGEILNLSATGATLGESSVTLKEAEWTEYTVAIRGATGSVNIKFEAKNATKNRFFLDDVVVSQASVNYSNYSTTCAAAPIATVNPTSVTATAAGVNGTLEVSYENVNTANVSVALYNDDACTEAFTAGWLTADLDGDKNITYTVAATTLYTERKAYIQLTAPDAAAATDPDVVVIPVTQAGKDKVFASLDELVAADLTSGDEVTVTLNNDVIKEFYIYSSKRCGVVFDVQKDGKDIKIYFNSQTTIDDWAEGGKLSGTLTNVKWTKYSSAWQLAPANTWAWANLTYTEPKAVSAVIVSGAPTKTTYVDGEAFDPAGLTVTVNYNDATSEVNPTGVTFEVTPATLTKGETSVSVTATYNTVSSAPYEVTGLTVNDIPTKTIAEFIEAGGTRCYLEGIVSNITNITYGNFDLTDESGTIYVYGCLNGAGEEQKFADLGVKNGDKIKVIADEYELYGGTKDEAKNVQYVSHVSAASITISDITMEVEEVATITATVDPADAVVTYTIKENAANAISLNGNTITALAEGTATITATVAEGATYLGNSVDVTVTVGPKSVSEDVVILAEHNGQWYALKAEDLNGDKKVLAALAVTYFNGTLYNVNESDKTSITWTRTVVGDQVTFKNGTNYLYVANPSKTELSLNATAFSWTYDAVLDTYTSNNGARTFLYSSEANGFKNFAINNNVGTKNYSGYPVVTAPVYATADLILGDVNNATIVEALDGQTVDVVVKRSFTANDGWYTLSLPFDLPQAQLSKIGKAYTIPTDASKYTCKDGEITVNVEQVTQLNARMPYLILPTADIDGFVAKNVTIAYENGTKGLVPVNDISDGNGNNYDFSMTSELYVGGTETTDGLYWVGNGGYLYSDNVQKLALRAYFNIAQAGGNGIPPRFRVVAGENVETGVGNITSEENTAIKVIENGQLIIIREGVKYNVQGVRL